AAVTTVPGPRVRPAVGASDYRRHEAAPEAAPEEGRRGRRGHDAPEPATLTPVPSPAPDLQNAHRAEREPGPIPTMGDAAAVTSPLRFARLDLRYRTTPLVSKAALATPTDTVTQLVARIERARLSFCCCAMA